MPLSDVFASEKGVCTEGVNIVLVPKKHPEYPNKEIQDVLFIVIPTCEVCAKNNPKAPPTILLDG